MSEKEIMEIYQRNVDAVYGITMSYLKNAQDTEDVVQGTFLKMIEKNMTFDSPSHERGWLIATASNACKNHLSYWFNKKRSTSLILETFSDVSEEKKEILELVLALPNRYKNSIYLYYYEGFSTEEIARILEKPSSTIRTQLERGRKLLKTLIQEERSNE